MSILKLRPSRAQSKPTDVIADLDALISNDVGFIFQGKTHRIKAITTENFFNVTNAIAKLDSMRNGKYTKADLLGTYAGIFSSVCDTIGPSDIENMTQAQVGALFQLILDCVTGKSQVTDLEKKKANLNP